MACLRIVFIHDYRRLLRRDPELPDALLAAEWPGQKARLLCKELYRRLAPASERHLDRCLVLADGTIPPADPAFAAASRRTTRWRRCRCRGLLENWQFFGVDRRSAESHFYDPLSSGQSVRSRFGKADF